MDKIMYYCSECKKLYKVGGTGKKVKCNSCGNELIDLKVTDEEYALMDSAERNALKEKAGSVSESVVREESISPVEETPAENSFFGQDKPRKESSGSFFGMMPETEEEQKPYEPIYAFDRPASDFNNGIDPADQAKKDIIDDKKVNFFAIPVFSVLPHKYHRLVRENGGKIFAALLIWFIILNVITGIMASFTINDLANELRNELPDFELANGMLTIEEPMLMDEDGTYIMIDDSLSGITASDIDTVYKSGYYKQIFIAGNDSAAIFSDGRVQTIKYTDLSGFEISRDKLCNKWIPMLKPIIIICMIIGALFSIGIYYLAALIIQFPAAAITEGVTKCEFDKNERFKSTVLAKFPAFFLVYIIKKIGLNVGFLANVILQLIIVVLIMCLYKKSVQD